MRDNFYRYALYMLKYKGRLFFGLSCALLSASVFGAGVFMALPILRVLLGNQGTRQAGAGAGAAAATSPNFREAIRRLDETKLHGYLPDSLIEGLPEDIFRGFIVLMSVFLAFTILGGITRVIHGYMSMRVALQTVQDIRLMAFSRIMHLPLLTFGVEPVAERASRMMRDTDRLGKGFTALVSKSLGYLLKGLVLLVVAFLLNWSLALFAILTAPVLVLVSRWFGKRIRRASKRALAQAAVMLGTISQSFQGLRVVKVHNAERVEVGRLRQANAKFLRLDRPLRLGKAMAAPTIETIGVFSFGLIAIYAAWQIFNGRTTPEEVGGSLVALLLALTTLRPLTYVMNEVQEASAAADRIAEIMEMKPEKPLHGEPRLPRLPRFSDAIVLDDVVFQYPTAERPALNSISLRVSRGTTAAFVGPNGCGKTTLLSLIPRLFDPTSGAVLIDGHDLCDVSLHSLRRQVGVVTQEVVLFHDTIANNIAYGNGTASRERIEAAARSARADEFIRSKPKGYDTIIGDQGLTLSGGERQRLAIARAILRDPAILILDEATSMIDADSEAKITEALEEFCRGRTSLVIAHRLSTVVHADVIYVMDRGRIVDHGTHGELLGRCELYRQLCRTQLVSEDGRPAALDADAAEVLPTAAMLPNGSVAAPRPAAIHEGA